MTVSHTSVYKLCYFLFNSTDNNMCRKWLAESITHCDPFMKHGWNDQSWFRSRSMLSVAHSVMFIEDQSKKLKFLQQASKFRKSDCNKLYNMIGQDYLNNHQSHLEAKAYLLVLLAIIIVLLMVLFYAWRKNIKQPKCSAKVPKRIVRMIDQIHVREKSLLQRNSNKSVAKSAYLKFDVDKLMNPQRLLSADGTPCLPLVLPDKRTLANCLIPNKLNLDGKIKSRTDSDFRLIACDKLLSVLDQSDKKTVHLTLVTLDEPVYDQEQETIIDNEHSKDAEIKARSTQRIDKLLKAKLLLNASQRSQKGNDMDSQRNIADAAVKTTATMLKSVSPATAYEKSSSPRSFLIKPTELRDTSPKRSPRHVQEFLSARNPHKSALTITRASSAGGAITKAEPYRRNTMSELDSHKKSLYSSAK